MSNFDDADDKFAEQADVTVILRCYNRAATVSDAIDSVLAQSLPAKEILVVDDGSSDGTADLVLQRYEGHVTLLTHKENHGTGAAANTAIAAVTTPFFAFLDSDDTWHPDFLWDVLAALKSRAGATLAFTDFRVVYGDYHLDRAVSVHADEEEKHVLAPAPFTLSTVMVRTRAARAVGALNEEVLIGEDFDFFNRLWLRAQNSFVHVKRPLVNHRLWAGNTTSDFDRLINDMSALVQKYADHPFYRRAGFLHADYMKRHALGVIGRRQVQKWLAAAPSRPTSLIVFGASNTDAVLASLESARAQRLPPLDAVVSYDPDTLDQDDLRRIQEGDWPFHVWAFPTGGAVSNSLGSTILKALAMVTGKMIVFLRAGDTFRETALDDYRRAFSSASRPVGFSYGGYNETSPRPLSSYALERAAEAVLFGSPGALSSMAVSRSALLKCTGLGTLPVATDWVGLFLTFACRDETLVRISRPVVDLVRPPEDSLEQRFLDLEAIAETDDGRVLNGVVDQIAGILESGSDQKLSGGRDG